METNNKLRDALEKCANWGEQIDCQLGSSDETVYAFRDERSLAHNISECARSALAEPPRNCDIVPNEAREAADMFHRERPCHGYCYETHDWLLAHATEKEGGAK